MEKVISVKAKELPVADWVPLNEAFARVKAALNSSDLALRDLLDHLRGGRLPSAMRCIGRDDAETSGELEASFWQQVTLSEGHNAHGRSGKVAVRFVDPCDVVTFSAWYFVARRELDTLYPASSAQLNDSSDTPPPITPGPKPTKDWPTFVAKWLIAVAVDDPQRLQNVDVLVAEAQDFLDKRIGWAPKDTKKLRAKIVDLLEFVRG